MKNHVNPACGRKAMEINMIYTLTLNPSIDYISEIENLNIGAVNRSKSEAFVAGGKGINVSVVLKNMGRESCALGFLGGFTGRFIEDELKSQGIKTDFVQLEDGISRINLKLKDEKETEINSPGPFVSKKEIKCLEKKLEELKDGDTLVLAGSIPLGFGKDFYADIMKKLSSKNIHFVVDAEKELLKNTLKYRPFLIKPNNFELEEIIGEKLDSKEKIIEAAKKLQNMGAQNIIVSMGKDGGAFLSEEGKAYFCPSPKGMLVNSTGAGDSVVAGFLFEYGISKDLEKAFVFGLSCGSATAFSQGFAQKEDAVKLYDEISEKLCIM